MRSIYVYIAMHNIHMQHIQYCICCFDGAYCIKIDCKLSTENVHAFTNVKIACVKIYADATLTRRTIIAIEFYS